MASESHSDSFGNCRCWGFGSKDALRGDWRCSSEIGLLLMMEVGCGGGETGRAEQKT